MLKTAFKTWQTFSIEKYCLHLLATRKYPLYEYVEMEKIRDRIPKSDTVVIYGCGRSLLEISETQWKQLNEFNSIGLSYFIVYNNFVRMDINHFREVGSFNFTYDNTKIHNIEEQLLFAKAINENPFNRDTIHLFQKGIRARASNYFIMSEAMKHGKPYSLYVNSDTLRNRLSETPGILSHFFGSLCDMVNLAYQLRWKRIILAGIDLYDRGYFFNQPGETMIWDQCRGMSVEDKHNMSLPAVEGVKEVLPQLQARGIEISVLNPKSLLTEILPVYQYD